MPLRPAWIAPLSLLSDTLPGCSGSGGDAVEDARIADAPRPDLSAQLDPLSGHVSDDPTDLKYAGTQPWQPSKLDVGRDDYHGHGKAGCLDLQTSAYLTAPSDP